MAFNDKNIVLIGGSSGIGFSTARLAYQQGATVTITGTSTTTAQQAAERIGNVTAYPLNITNEQAVNQLFNQLTDIDHVFVSAGGTRVGSLFEDTVADHATPMRFNAVSPGYTDTPMWDTVLGDNREQVLATVAQSLPVKRIAQPDEVAQAVLFLMQNESVTGEVIHVDGGARFV